MVTTAPAAGIDDDGTLDRDALAAMAAAATVVIVAAWDAEALVLWQGAEPG